MFRLAPVSVAVFTKIFRGVMAAVHAPAAATPAGAAVGRIDAAAGSTLTTLYEADVFARAMASKMRSGVKG
jgi:hypothetical protein